MILGLEILFQKSSFSRGLYNFSNSWETFGKPLNVNFQIDF